MKPTHTDDADENSKRVVSRSELEIQSLLKGLRIIEAINERPGMILAQIAVRCGLPRTTAHRALRTLEQHEFVYRDAATARYYAHRRVLRLASSFDPMADLTVRIRDEFEAISDRIAWPMHFAIPAFEGNCPQIMVQVSTDHVSPLAVDKLLPGSSIPALQCAAGLVCVSALPDCERSTMVRRALSTPCDRPTQMRWTERAVDEALEKSRNRGYATFVLPARHTNLIGLAVPVALGDRVVGAVSVRFAESAVPVREAEARFLPALRALAARVTDTAVPAFAARAPRIASSDSPVLHS